MTTTITREPSAPKQPGEDDAALLPGAAGRERSVRWPRPETALLAFALLWTLAAKLVIVVGQEAQSVPVALTVAVLPDLVFFASALLVFALLHTLGVPRLVARLTLIAAAVILGWSVANAAWLLATSVQLQPGVIGVLMQDPSEFWPIVQEHLIRRPIYSVPLLLTIGAAATWFAWRLVRIRPVRGGRGLHLRSAGVAGVVVLVATFGVWLGERGGTVAYSGQVIGFSSHWYAINDGLGLRHGVMDVTGVTRVLARAGERDVTLPDGPGAPRPNVVVILLESVSHRVTSLAPDGPATTPYFARLAGEGVEFVETRVPVAQTSKAFWSSFTGVLPDLSPDYVESVPVDEPYESLASILGAVGYRSAFFQMSRGSFECAPGMFANLGFDWAWFRENLNDESAYLGYMNGDDLRMIGPMFEWVDEADGPFLLGMITSVAHDPYELPADFPEPPAEDRYERYLQAVRHGDMVIEAVCAGLEVRGRLDDTVLCIIGDHGDGFRPESKRGRWAPYEEVIRVPWVVRWPGHVEAGRRVEWPCSQLDVTPTILALLGADISAAGFDGCDALTALEGTRRQFFSTWYEDAPIGYVEGDRKLVYWPYTDTLFEYDLASDPGERERRTVEGAAKEEAVAAMRTWLSGSRVTVPARRFAESTEYRHWRTFSSGRSAWAYYVP